MQWGKHWKIEVGIRASSSGAGTVCLKVDVDFETLQAIKTLYFKSPQVLSFHPIESISVTLSRIKRTADV